MAAQLTDDLVMPIIVRIDEASTHQSVIRDVAVAVAEQVHQLASIDDPALRRWLATGMRKTVRKAAKAQDARVVIGDLKPYEAFLPAERRAQVSGWSLPHDRQLTIDEALARHVERSEHGLTTTFIAADAALSTGKAAAAAAHVSTLLVLTEHLGTVIGESIEEVLFEDLASTIKRHPSRFRLIVRDNGHTEVEPGTVTAALLKLH